MNRYKLHEPPPYRWAFREGDKVQYKKNPENTGTVIIIDGDARGPFICVRWNGQRDICVGESTDFFELA